MKVLVFDTETTGLPEKGLPFMITLSGLILFNLVIYYMICQIIVL